MPNHKMSRPHPAKVGEIFYGLPSGPGRGGGSDRPMPWSPSCLPADIPQESGQSHGRIRPELLWRRINPQTVPLFFRPNKGKFAFFA